MAKDDSTPGKVIEDKPVYIVSNMDNDRIYSNLYGHIRLVNKDGTTYKGKISKRRILQERERNKMIRASLMISKRQRILKARKVVGSMAAKIIQKFVDPLTGDMYYYNPRTKQRSYDKPEILGKQDVEKPFILPDKHYEFVVNCASCKRKVATVLCDPCGDAYCDDCFKSLHSKGNKSKHHKDAIPKLFL